MNCTNLPFLKRLNDNIPCDLADPFGFGLSYTEFLYENLVVPANVNMNEAFIVSIEVSNTGKSAGSEVVQLYIRDRIGSVTRPVKELKGFEKTFLNPGETKKVEFIITPEMLSFYNIEMKKIVEPGVFDIMIGGNSEEVISKSFNLSQQ